MIVTPKKRFAIVIAAVLLLLPLVLSGCGKPPDDIAPPNAATDTPAALDAVPAAEEEPAAAGEIVEEPPDEPPFQAIAEPELGTELVDEYSYHYSPEVLETDLRELADTYKGQIELGTYGTTVRGRDLHYAVIGLGSKAIVFTGGIHGREYLASVATMNVLEELLRKQKTGDPEASAVLAEYKVYFLPSANPDGAAISQSGEITKIKANANLVDLNRNFADYLNARDIPTITIEFAYGGAIVEPSYGPAVKNTAKNIAHALYGLMSEN